MSHLKASPLDEKDLPCAGGVKRPMEARDYQVELLEQAKVKNSIVFLGTGSGKTFIATMLIKHYMDDMLRFGKKTVFLVPSVPLVDQQCAFIQETTSLIAKSFCGADGVDDWTEAEWREVFNSTNVLVMIVQVFLDAMDHGYLRMRDTCLLILDECHHAVGRSPYVQIFKNHYHPLKLDYPRECPRVLALSASIVPTRCTIQNFQEKKKELEAILDSEVITTTNLGNLLKYVTNPKEEYEEYDTTLEIQEFISIFEHHFLEKLNRIQNDHILSKELELDMVTFGNIKEEVERKCKKYRKYISRFAEAIRTLGLYCGKSLITEEKTNLENDRWKCNEKYEQEMVETVEKYHEELMEIINQKEGNLNDVVEFSTKKVHKLINILYQPFQERDRMVAIIFVKQRVIASALAYILQEFVKKLPQHLGHLKVGFAVGGTDYEANKLPGAKKMENIDEERKN